VVTLGRPHDVPTAAELVEAVREWIERDVGSGAPVSPFHARVATNVLAMVERELQLGGEHDRRHGERLAALGVVDDGELAAGIRSGRFDDRIAEVRELVWQSVCDKLAVANPSYLGGHS
jgi:Domain of unknown function (DUF6285)